MIFILMLAIGLAMAAANTWQRLGRSSAARRWARGTHPDFAQRNVLILWPSVAVALVAGASLGAVQRLDAPTWPAVLPLVLALGVFLVYAVLPLRVPSLLQPRWYREQPGRGSDRPAGTSGG